MPKMNSLDPLKYFQSLFSFCYSKEGLEGFHQIDLGSARKSFRKQPEQLMSQKAFLEILATLPINVPDIFICHAVPVKALGKCIEIEFQTVKQIIFIRPEGEGALLRPSDDKRFDYMSDIYVRGKNIKRFYFSKTALPTFVDLEGNVIAPKYRTGCGLT